VPLFDEKNATSNALIMFINERPGRIGTGASGKVSFDNNDPTAKQFKECFEQLNIPRTKIFITNACLCYPDSENYRDKAPKTSEIDNCQYYLKKEIETTNPKLIVPLGAKALNAIKRFYIKQRNLKDSELKKLQAFKLKYNIGEVIKLKEITIYPLYHTSKQVQNKSRNSEQQKKDWLKIKQLIK
jgi:uracil-DNA glycosylase family 4